MPVLAGRLVWVTAQSVPPKKLMAQNRKEVDHWKLQSFKCNKEKPKWRIFTETKLMIINSTESALKKESRERFMPTVNLTGDISERTGHSEKQTLELLPWEDSATKVLPRDVRFMETLSTIAWLQQDSFIQAFFALRAMQFLSRLCLTWKKTKSKRCLDLRRP